MVPTPIEALIGGGGGGDGVDAFAPTPTGDATVGGVTIGEPRPLPAPGPRGENEPNRLSSRSIKTDKSNGERGVLIVSFPGQ